MINLATLQPTLVQVGKLYTGTKTLHAWPMTRGQYNDYRKWDTPPREDKSDAGYLVEYVDGGEANDFRHKGYISWTPADVFERTYRLVSAADPVQAGEQAEPAPCDDDPVPTPCDDPAPPTHWQPTEHDKRAQALGSAIQATQNYGKGTPPLPPEDIVAYAKAFYEFVNADTAKTNTDPQQEYYRQGASALVGSRGANAKLGNASETIL